VKIAALPTAKYSNEYVPFRGGLDLVTPAIEIPPGFVRESVNYEENLFGGYQHLTGYERFDGRASPSNALTFAVPYSNAGTIVPGNTLIGSTSGATAYVIDIDQNAIIVTNVVGNFASGGENANFGVILTDTQGGIVDSALGLAQYKALAEAYYRALIGAVPGAGAIRGVWYYNNVVYAFRDNVGTGVGMYKSSPTGWQAVSLGFQVAYSAASGTSPIEGATIVQGAVSGVLKRITLESGSFGAGTAAGRLIFASITGGSFSAGVFTSGITATCNGQTTISLPNKGGRFEFVNANFSGALGTYRMYGADGVNPAFEFDGTTFVPIETPLDITRKPSHVAAHQNQLFLAYGSSLLNSNLGDPYNFATANTAEIAVSETITGFMTQPGNDNTPALAVYCRNHTYMLYGKTGADFQLVEFNDQAGALPFTIQKINTTLVFDDRGVTSLQTAQEFGNFLESALSNRVKNLLNSKRSRVVDSHISRDKQQYRLFFNDGSGMYFLLTSQNFSMMSVNFPNPVLCSVSAEELTSDVLGGGNELIFFGSDNGFVYQMERGTSFDSADITANLSFVFNNLKSYRALKRFRHITLESQVNGFAAFELGYSLSYGSEEVSQPDNTAIESAYKPVFWDNFTWDAFTWDGVNSLQTIHVPITGNGQNLAVKIQSSSAINTAFLLNGYFLEYSLLRMLR
jgi:hypothetical protein